MAKAACIAVSWVNGLRLVARELARVLRPTGSLWLNLGDSYSRRLAGGHRITNQRLWKPAAYASVSLQK